jgi:hypothetical protein
LKDTILKTAVDEVIALKMASVNDFIATSVEPIIASLGNPEKLINVPWNQWTDWHKQILFSIYGNQLQEYIAKKAIAEMRALEAEVI